MCLCPLMRHSQVPMDLARADLVETGKAARELGLFNGKTTPSPYAAALEANGITCEAASRKIT